MLATVMLISCGPGGFDEEKIVIDKNSTVIDVRTAQEYKKGHLHNAVNIAHVDIKDKIAEYVPDKNKKIILYCRSGRRSGIAKKTLNDMGYKNVINAGAYKKLQKEEAAKQKQ